MKKSFIKRRKRVAPALQGHDRTETSPHNPPSQASTSPEAPSPGSAPGAPSPNPQTQSSNIDPYLDKSAASAPVPVDFTSYQGKADTAAAKPTPAYTYYDPLHDSSHHQPAPSPKRQRVSPNPLPLNSAPQSTPSADPYSSTGVVALPIHNPRPGSSASRPSHPLALATPEIESMRQSSQYEISPQDSEEEKRRKKIKREILRQHIAEMQKQVADLGESDQE